MCKQQIQTCNNCEFFLNKSTPPVREDPGEFDWACGHEDSLLHLAKEPQSDFQSVEEELEFYAQDCPGYVYKDWDKYFNDLAAAEAQMEAELKVNPAELEELFVASEQRRLRTLGLLDSDGNPTDEYYRQSDWAYDARR